MSEVILEFPYFNNENENGIMLSGSSRGILDKLINYNKYHVQVTLYPSKSELDYALESPSRYSMVDVQFKVGRVKEFNPSNGKIYVEVDNEDNILPIKHGKLLPRMKVKKIIEGGVEKLEIVDIISLDILQ